MGKLVMDRSEATLVDSSVQDEMARANRALRSLAPVIAHLLDSDGMNLVNDAIVARLRGMLSHIASQLLSSQGEAGVQADDKTSAHSVLVGQLGADERVTRHLYAVALELHLTDGLEQRGANDPVLTPLMQELIASDRPATAETAMAAMAAQSRFVQLGRRMELPIGELPFEVFTSVIDHLETVDLGFDQRAVADALSGLRGDFDEGTGRLGLLARLVSGMQGGAIAALDIGHAGLALFASAAASQSRQTRDDIIFACHESQAMRLALSLKAAGLEKTEIEKQFSLLGGSAFLPQTFGTLLQADALNLLHESGGV
ncbi:MAG: hypothetical protein AAFY42_01265 [Pseudomonadota bacterium]